MLLSPICANNFRERAFVIHETNWCPVPRYPFYNADRSVEEIWPMSSQRPRTVQWARKCMMKASIFKTLTQKLAQIGLEGDVLQQAWIDAYIQLYLCIFFFIMKSESKFPWFRRSVLLRQGDGCPLLQILCICGNVFSWYIAICCDSFHCYVRSLEILSTSVRFRSLES